MSSLYSYFWPEKFTSNPYSYSGKWQLGGSFDLSRKASYSRFAGEVKVGTKGYVGFDEQTGMIAGGLDGHGKVALSTKSQAQVSAALPQVMELKRQLELELGLEAAVEVIVNWTDSGEFKVYFQFDVKGKLDEKLINQLKLGEYGPELEGKGALGQTVGSTLTIPWASVMDEGFVGDAWNAITGGMKNAASRVIWSDSIYEYGSDLSQYVGAHDGWYLTSLYQDTVSSGLTAKVPFVGVRVGLGFETGTGYAIYAKNGTDGVSIGYLPSDSYKGKVLFGWEASPEYKHANKEGIRDITKADSLLSTVQAELNKIGTWVMQNAAILKGDEDNVAEFKNDFSRMIGRLKDVLFANMNPDKLAKNADAKALYERLAGEGGLFDRLQAALGAGLSLESASWVLFMEGVDVGIYNESGVRVISPIMEGFEAEARRQLEALDYFSSIDFDALSEFNFVERNVTYVEKTTGPGSKQVTLEAGQSEIELNGLTWTIPAMPPGAYSFGVNNGTVDPDGQLWQKLQETFGETLGALTYVSLMKDYRDSHPELTPPDKPMFKTFGRVEEGGYRETVVRVDIDGKESVAAQYFYPGVSDPSAATERFHVEAAKDADKDSSIKYLESRIDGQWQLRSTEEVRHYSGLTVLKTTHADDPEHYDLDVKLSGSGIAGELLPLSSFGASLGSTIGSLVAGDDVFRKLTVSPFLAAVGENIAEAMGIGATQQVGNQGQGNITDHIGDVFANFPAELGAHMRDAAGGMVGSLLTAELMRAIKAEGLAVDLASSVSSAVLSKIGSNILTMGLNEISGGATAAALGTPSGIFSGVGVDLVGNAVGGFVGTRLAMEAMAGFDSEEEAIGAQVGGAVAGAAMLIYGIGMATGPVGWAIAALAAFGGNVLGGAIGDMVNNARPDKASAQVVFNDETGEFEVGYTWKKRDGNVAGVKSLANAASESLNYVMTAVGGELLKPDEFSGQFLWKESRNLHGPGYAEKGSYFEAAGGLVYWYQDANDFGEVVERGVIDMLERIELAGGDPYLKRAMYQSLSKLVGEDGRPVDNALQVLAGNFRIATDYAAYLKNREAINSLIAMQPDSAFAAGWIATLAHAADLGLNRRHASDHFGGWQYMLDNAGGTAAQTIVDYSEGSRLVEAAGSGHAVLIGDLVEADSKTLIEGSGLIDLRDSTRNLFVGMRYEDGLLIDTTSAKLPEALTGLRLDGSTLWLNDKKLVDINASGISAWHDLATGLAHVDFLNTLAKNLSSGKWRLVEGGVEVIAARVETDGAITVIGGGDFLTGARLEDGNLLASDDSLLARVLESGKLVPAFDQAIPVSAIVRGGDGADTIYSGDLGNDIFAGGGDDTVIGGANADWIYGGEGNDKLQAGSADGNALFGETGNDELMGGARSDWLDGGAGDDHVVGGAGDDVLAGGAGIDILEGGLGDDRYIFGRGDGATTIDDKGASSAGEDKVGDMLSLGADITPDQLSFEQVGDDLLVHVSGADGGAEEVLTVVGWNSDAGKLESMELADGTRIPIGHLETFHRGTDGDDAITSDLVTGDALVQGLGGNDVIDLQAAAAPEASAIGGGLFRPIVPVATEAGHGHVVFGGAGNDTVLGGSKGDSILGDEGDDVLDGFAGNDRVAGGAGKDTLRGGLGQDELYGGADNDVVEGGEGDDMLSGGLGDDALNGGKGNDNYVFGRGNGNDTVTDEAVSAPGNAGVQSLLERVDKLLAGDSAGEVIDKPSADGVVLVPVADSNKATLTGMVDELINLASLVSAETSDLITTPLQQMKKRLNDKMFHPDVEELDRVLRQFRHLVLAVDGQFDAITLGQNIEIGDFSLSWDGPDLLMNLNDRADSAGAAISESIRLAGWQGVTPFVERLDFAEGQLDLAGIKEWVGGTDDADVLTGGDDSGWMTGGLGNDEIHAAAGDDIVNGNQGDDVLYGEAGADIIAGGLGNDSLFGGDGNDSLKGGAGDDILDGGSGADTLDGGEGVDTVSYANAASGVRAFLDNGASRTVDHGLAGVIHEKIGGEGTVEARDKLIADLLDAMPDRDESIQKLVDAVPLVAGAKSTVLEWVKTGKRDDIVALLQGAYDESAYLLSDEERLALQQAVDGVKNGTLPAAEEFESFWQPIAQAFPDRTVLADRIEERILTRDEMGAKIGELVTAGNREALVTTITNWLKPLSAGIGIGAIVDGTSAITSNGANLDSSGALIGIGAIVNDTSTITSNEANLDPSGAVIGPVVAPEVAPESTPVLGDATDEKLAEILTMIPETLPAAREPLLSLPLAGDLIGSTEPYIQFDATTLDYGPEDKDTLGSFLGTDGTELTAGQRYSPFDNLGVKLTGYIYLDKGKHDFTVTAADGFELKIGGLALAATSGNEVSADFEEGFYSFELTYFDATDAEELRVTSNSLAGGAPLGEALFFKDPMQVDPRLAEKTDAAGRTYLEYPDTEDRGDRFVGVEALIGSAYDDTLGGDAGDNRLAGGAGNDTYVFGRGHGVDTIVEDDATAGNSDTLSFMEGVESDQIWFRRVGDDLEASIIGTNDKLIVDNWYLGDQYHVEQFKTADGKTLLDSEVENLVQAMASFAPPAAGQTTLSESYQKTLDSVIVASW